MSAEDRFHEIIEGLGQKLLIDGICCSSTIEGKAPAFLVGFENTQTQILRIFGLSGEHDAVFAGGGKSECHRNGSMQLQAHITRQSTRLELAHPIEVIPVRPGNLESNGAVHLRDEPSGGLQILDRFDGLGHRPACNRPLYDVPSAHSPVESTHNRIHRLAAAVHSKSQGSRSCQSY